MNAPPRFINDEETGKEYMVVGYCYNCMRPIRGKIVAHAWVYNKRSGLLHIPINSNEGYTECGKAATGKTWLWQS